jgi:hypothetical protein
MRGPVCSPQAAPPPHATGRAPTNLEANWLFRLTETEDPADHATAIRVCPLRAVLPLALLCLAVGLVNTDWLFLGFRKISFTCSYLPGKADLRRSWPLAALVLGVPASPLEAKGARRAARVRRAGGAPITQLHGDE